MFIDPVTVTINGGGIDLVKINQDNYGSEYRKLSDTNDLRMRIRNSSYVRKSTGIKVERHTVELTETVFGQVGPEDDTLRKIYLVVENEAGDSINDFTAFTAGLTNFVDNAVVAKLLNGES